MTRRGLRVFIISEGDDIGGVAIAIQRAFEKHAPNWTVRSMRGSNNYIDYPVDLSWDPAQFHEMWAWADVVHAMERTMNLTGLYNPPGKPVLLHHHGQIYRWNTDAMNALSDAHNLVTICSTIDMEALSPRTKWLPNPVDLDYMQALRAQYRPDPFRSTLRFVHSPTAFRKEKGTDQWQAAVKAVGGELKLTEGKSWAQALAAKATGDVHLDQLFHCYGNSGLEAMGMGLPVVSGGFAEIEAAITKKIGYLPYQPAMGMVVDAVREMLEPTIRKQVADAGWQYINDYHAQEKVVARLKRFYTEARDRYDPTEGPW
ncbi:MAG TPA: hypothetical protein VN756_08825 [Solirubrobacterales bacterium]|nr:hypothetical protein [Solirubrobacterales bacterium]